MYIQIFANDGSYIQLATFPHPKKEEVIVKLPLDPPLKNGWEARPTMFRFKREAYAKYNVVSKGDRRSTVDASFDLLVATSKSAHPCAAHG